MVCPSAICLSLSIICPWFDHGNPWTVHGTAWLTMDIGHVLTMDDLYGTETEVSVNACIYYNYLFKWSTHTTNEYMVSIYLFHWSISDIRIKVDISHNKLSQTSDSTNCIIFQYWCSHNTIYKNNKNKILPLKCKFKDNIFTKFLKIFVFEVEKKTD